MTWFGVHTSLSLPTVFAIEIEIFYDKSKKKIIVKFIHCSYYVKWFSYCSTSSDKIIVCPFSDVKGKELLFEMFPLPLSQPIFQPTPGMINDGGWKLGHIAILYQIVKLSLTSTA